MVFLATLAVGSVGLASAAIIYVNPGDSIQSAVTAANASDTIIVRDGTYTENIDINKRLTIRSENGSANCIVQAANSNDHVFSITSDYVNISGFTVKGATAFMKSCIYGEYVANCIISNNNVSTANVGIYFHWGCSNNLITKNDVTCPIGEYGVYIDRAGSNNEINNNTFTDVQCGIEIYHTSNCIATNNTLLNNYVAISFGYEGTNNLITKNNIINSSYRGILFDDGSCNNVLYLNNLINSSPEAVFTGYGPLTNTWISPNQINYTYNGHTYTNYMGNYWDNYSDVDTNNDGIWDTGYSMPASNSDGYPLVEPWQDYFEPPQPPPIGLLFRYTGDVLPSADGWSIMWYENYESTCAQIEDGVLHLTDPYTYGGSALSYYRGWPASADYINVAEFDVKVVSCSGISGVLIATNDDDYNMGYTLFTDRVQSRYAITTNSTKEWYLGDVYYFDTTSQFNTYRAIIDDGKAKLYLNGVLVLEQPAGTGTYKEDWPPTLNYSNGIEFGVAGSPTTGEAYFDEVRAYALPDTFDTRTPTNPYPSISGIFNGTIKLDYTINVSKFYTYPCSGTGGHTEYVKIWNNTGWNVTATWNGYSSDWHNITFNETFLLNDDEEYYCTIVTRSYPQIHHTDSLLTLNGWINCSMFTDANGKDYFDWIPAIRLE